MSFSNGMDLAVEALVEIAEGGADFHDALSFINDTLHQELEKTASEEDMDVKRGLDSVFFDFMKHASEIAGLYDLSDMDSRDVLGAVLYSMAEDYEERANQEIEKEAAESSMNVGDLLPVSNYMKPKNAENSHHVDGRSQPSRFHTAKSKISEAFGRAVSTGSSMATKRMA